MIPGEELKQYRACVLFVQTGKIVVPGLFQALKSGEKLGGFANEGEADVPDILVID